MAHSTAIAGNAYGTYVNERHGYSIEYPKFLIPQGVSDSGDGQIFLPKSGKGELRVYAEACVEGQNETPSRFIQMNSKARGTDAVKVTYSQKGRTFAVISGTQGSNIIYRKLLLNGEWCTELDIQYPASERNIYDKEIPRISASLKYLD